ncbi:MAG TPA: hypothetical protein VIX89_12755 [Bryobacteraceae bacterium]
MLGTRILTVAAAFLIAGAFLSSGQTTASMSGIVSVTSGAAIGGRVVT